VSPYPVPGTDELLGLSDGHVAPVAEGCSLVVGVLMHPQAAEAFIRLREDARRAGFDLRVASGFRSFHRQLAIWNAKARGERAVLDACERPLPRGSLSAAELVEAILHWSALPGASRHHWGSDIDVVDAAASTTAGTDLLRLDACREGGCYAALHGWLDERIRTGRARDFFRPFDGSSCAVAAEPWHLSFAPVAASCQARLDPDRLRSALASAGLELWASVEPELEDILQRYVKVPAVIYPAPWRSRLSGQEPGHAG